MGDGSAGLSIRHFILGLRRPNVKPVASSLGRRQAQKNQPPVAPTQQSPVLMGSARQLQTKTSLSMATMQAIPRRRRSRWQKRPRAPLPTGPASCRNAHNQAAHCHATTQPVDLCEQITSFDHKPFFHSQAPKTKQTKSSPRTLKKELPRTP